ncbi:MAG TPA: right-handed parallel beta-helix repeat-containing protein, partial [Sphingobacterium sp.]|nr:right-handed parallel beta-helix repeat-containing protein [Sphingobacterium sp.]
AHTSVISLNKDTLITIENAKLKSMVNHVGNGIYGANCDNITVSHTEVSGWSHGVNSVSLNYFTFSNSKVTGSSQFGVFLSNNKYALFENNVYTDNRQIAHYIRSGGDGMNQIINNEFVDNGFETPNTYAQLTIAESARKNTFSGNIFRTSSHTNKPKHAVLLDNSTLNNVVTGNTFETGSYATSAVQDDANGQNQTN